MNKRSILRIIFILIVIIFNILIFKFGNSNGRPDGGSITLNLSVISDVSIEMQLYYSVDEEPLSEEKSVKSYVEAGTEVDAGFTFPYDSNIVRLDPAGLQTKLEITSVRLEIAGYRQELSADDFFQMLSEMLDVKAHLDDGRVILETAGDDGFVFLNIDKQSISEGYRQRGRTRNLIIIIIICLIIDFIAIYALRRFDALIDVPVEIVRDRKMALTLARNDFKTKYAGSYLGIVWAFIQPVTTILVYWFVFQIGFRSGNVKGVPFVLYLVSGIVPWFYFSDALNGGTSSLLEYSYLVKKVVFNIDILPFIKVVSAIFVHLFFVIFAIGLGCLCGYYPTPYMLQLIYYIFCGVVFSLGLSYLTSAIVVFFRDLTQFINIFVLQVGMWLTPIMWDENMLPGWLITVFKLNPMFYIVDGFRDAMVYRRWLWDGKIMWTIYFWVITFLVFGFGTKIFRRLKVHFADVL